MLISFSVTALLTGGLTLAICLGMLYGLAANSYSISKQVITDQSISSVYLKANEISTSINQQLRTIAESVALSGALYSESLLNSTFSKTSSRRTTMLNQEKTYREYNFIGNCSYPKCPSDYGAFGDRSRFPKLPGFVNGSLEHTSAYIYYSKSKTSIRDDSKWNGYVNKYDSVKRVIDGLTYHDKDLEIIFKRGPNTTVMFYVSAKVVVDSYSGDYIAVHRTFPGILKDSKNYDPPGRPWFANAPVGDVFLYGPYQETFTRQLVLTISSKKHSAAISGTTVVSAAVILLTAIENLIASVDYSNDGFGVLLKYSTLQVVVWKNKAHQTFDYSS